MAIIVAVLRVFTKGNQYTGESIPIRLFLAGFELTPTIKDAAKKFSVRYYLNLVLVDEEVCRVSCMQATFLTAPTS